MKTEAQNYSNYPLYWIYWAGAENNWSWKEKNKTIRVIPAENAMWGTDAKN